MKRLREIALAKEDTVVSEQYASALSDYITLKDQEGLFYSRLTSLFQQYQHNRGTTRAQKTRKRMAYVLGTMALMAAVFFMARRRHFLSQNETIKRQMEAERSAHETIQASLSGRLKQRNDALRTLSKQLKQDRMNAGVVDSDNHDDHSAFLQSPVCEHIVRIANANEFKTSVDHRYYKSHALSKEQLIAFRRAGYEHLPHFAATVRRKYPMLKSKDMDYCFLYLLGLHEADIAVLLQKSTSTVYERSRNIKCAIGSDNDLYQSLLDMLH